VVKAVKIKLAPPELHPENPLGRELKLNTQSPACTPEGLEILPLALLPSNPALEKEKSLLYTSVRKVVAAVLL
jgi:hypothetical protein